MVAVLPHLFYVIAWMVMQLLLRFFSLNLCDLFVLHGIVILVCEFLCIHLLPTVWISLSPYFIQLLTVVCEILSAIHVASYNFSYFFLRPSNPVFCLCIFGYILGLAALIVSG